MIKYIWKQARTSLSQNDKGISSRISVEVSSIPHGARQHRTKGKQPNFGDSSLRFLHGFGCVSCIMEHILIFGKSTHKAKIV